ncbi:MAG: CoxG family protein [Thermoleophilia bacterium]
MRVEQSFIVEQPPERVWDFFGDVAGVARCVPGVEAVEVVDDEHSNVRVRQSLGPMSATFDLSMKVVERIPVESIRFTAVGRSIAGAAGNLRTMNVVTLAPERDATRVSLASDLGLGGMIGSVGQKVVAKQAARITAEFAEALERALRGEVAPAAAPSPSSAAPGDGSRRARPVARRGAGRLGDPVVAGLAGLSAGLGVAVVVAVLLGRRR